MNRSVVPCNGCVACCTGDLIVLHPEHGDVVEDYETYDETNPLTGKTVKALKRKEDNSCIYLGDKGCTIHERAPAICREFDCRRFFQQIKDRNERRQLLKMGFVRKDVLDAGRKRLHTLPKSTPWKGQLEEEEMKEKIRQAFA